MQTDGGAAGRGFPDAHIGKEAHAPGPLAQMPHLNPAIPFCFNAGMESFG